MNIFVTNNCPIISAQALDNKRVVKMVLETAQLLSTAIFINSGVTYQHIYKPTHMKHPCTIWAALNIGNWDWLFQHFLALCEEYSFRYNKKHATTRLLPYLLEHRADIQDGIITPFANCTKSESMQVDFKHISDPCEAYRKYLNAKWHYDKLPPKWINREPPLWYNPLFLIN
ncbi:MAG TPA: pyrimidine dimer DNA glycosylase/endonuclease V [Rickettsia endosymbiont of Sericostoma sp.]|jgi:Pyrimidine dimer DNA glycosylase|nr:pyrimidine dimer DNA glycosylase/endonuclease V [Rickettsia endosymbiont of Sericostoma sp. HW-2014]HJD64429.1 pyrimidine dimer DNA glycosylase/endonuclease V [Rickettsia endosymbiont of Sericostoma sp.]